MLIPALEIIAEEFDDIPDDWSEIIDLIIPSFEEIPYRWFVKYIKRKAYEQ